MSAIMLSVSTYSIFISPLFTYSRNASNSIWKCLLRLLLPAPFSSAYYTFVILKSSKGCAWGLKICISSIISFIHLPSCAVCTTELASASVLLVSTLVEWFELQLTRQPNTKNMFAILLLLSDSVAKDASQKVTYIFSKLPSSLLYTIACVSVFLRYLIIQSMCFHNFCDGLFCHAAHLCSAQIMSGRLIKAAHHNFSYGAPNRK